MENQNLHYQIDQSLWGENQNHSSNQGNRQGFEGLQMVDQYQLAIYHDQQQSSNHISPSSDQSNQNQALTCIANQFLNHSDIKVILNIFLQRNIF